VAPMESDEESVSLQHGPRGVLPAAGRTFE
jgi:hypothetical protein